MKVPHPAMRWCLLGASLPVSPQFLPFPRGPCAPGETLVFSILSRSLLPRWVSTCCVLRKSLIGQPPAFLLLETPCFHPHLLLDTFLSRVLSTTCYAEKGVSPLASHVILVVVLQYRFSSFNTRRYARRVSPARMVRIETQVLPSWGSHSSWGERL